MKVIAMISFVDIATLVNWLKKLPRHQNLNYTNKTKTNRVGLT